MITPAEFVSKWQANKQLLSRPHRRDHWGSYDLVTYDADSVNRLAIPETSKRFLIEAGLPKSAFRHIMDFDMSYNDLPPIVDVVGYEMPAAYRRYRFMGSKGFFTIEGEFVRYGDFCLDEQANGAVVFVEASDEFKVWFMNSSVEQLAEYMLIFRQHEDWRIEFRRATAESHHNDDDPFDDNDEYDGSDEYDDNNANDEYVAEGRRLQQLLTEIDPRANEDDNYWTSWIYELIAT